MVTLVEFPGSMPSVLRAFFGASMLHAPHGEPVAAVVGHVEIGRILQRDSVQREVIAARKNSKAKIVLDAAGASLLRQIPPCDVLAQQLLAAAAVDDAVAHHSRALHLIAVDQRAAASPPGLA